MADSRITNNEAVKNESEEFPITCHAGKDYLDVSFQTFSTALQFLNLQLKRVKARIDDLAPVMLYCPTPLIAYEFSGYQNELNMINYLLDKLTNGPEFADAKKSNGGATVSLSTAGLFGNKDKKQLHSKNETEKALDTPHAAPRAN